MPSITTLTYFTLVILFAFQGVLFFKFLAGTNTELQKETQYIYDCNSKLQNKSSNTIKKSYRIGIYDESFLLLMHGNINE